MSLTLAGLTHKRRNKMASVCARANLVTSAARQIVALNVLSALNVPRRQLVLNKNAAILAQVCAVSMQNAA